MFFPDPIIILLITYISLKMPVRSHAVTLNSVVMPAGVFCVHGDHMVVWQYFLIHKRGQLLRVCGIILSVSVTDLPPGQGRRL